MNVATTLFRPVGLKELELIFDAAGLGYPPRLPEQPIFYPVLNQPYAEEIAGNWNTKVSAWVGFVTEFRVDAEYLSPFEPQVVGASRHAELWVPAEQLGEFNSQIIGKIQVVTAFYGEQYAGPHCNDGRLANATSREQPKRLVGIEVEALRDEISVNWKAMLMNFRHWTLLEPGALDLSEREKHRLLAAVQQEWGAACRDFQLPGEPIGAEVRQ